MKLKDKVVIVTGASKGLGVAMALQCAHEGAKVVCAARSVQQTRRGGRVNRGRRRPGQVGGRRRFLYGRFCTASSKPPWILTGRFTD